MLGFLAGVPGKLKSIKDAVTTYLDATVSSRAPASTALSTSVWTNSLAAELDGLAPAIAAIPVSFINSIQTGRISNVAGTSGSAEDRYYADATLSTVVVAKCIPFWFPNAECVNGPFHLRITSTTNLRVSTPIASATTISGRWYVIEFK